MLDITLDDFFIKVISSFLGGLLGVIILSKAATMGKMFGDKIQDGTKQIILISICVILLAALKTKASFALSWSQAGSLSLILMLFPILGYIKWQNMKKEEKDE